MDPFINEFQKYFEDFKVFIEAWTNLNPFQCY